MLACDRHVSVHMPSLTRVLILEFGNIVDVFVDDDPGTVALTMRGHVLFAKCLCHGGDGWSIRDEGKMRTTKIYIMAKE